MTTEKAKTNTAWHHFYGPNLGYVQELYEQYRQDPQSVDSQLRERFESWGPPPDSMEQMTPETSTLTPSSPDHITALKKVVAAENLIQNIRTYGHLAAKTNPLQDQPDADVSLLKPAAYDLSEEDLRAIPAHVIWPEAPEHVHNGLDAVHKLKNVYTKSLAYEFTHVHEIEEKDWLNRMVESETTYQTLSDHDRVQLLEQLIKVEEFERFLHRTFVGQKRFSIEGLDALVPMLDKIIHSGTKTGAKDFMIGMAHRGRLNVLAHNLGKPYEMIFAEFQHAMNKELVLSEGSIGINYGWTGDVKYHLGAEREFENGEDIQATIHLANNPSHLEFVNPVVQGYTRAAQETRDEPGFPKQDVSKALAILIHGDAAFPGEGVVAETLNLSRLPGYHTGGTIHIIANNQLGFTTENEDARSTKYASDLAKGFEIPIVHVNADDPDACMAAVELAVAYRTRFQKDFLIDLIGYRRFGHNEMDDPTPTQSQMYVQINEHPTVRSIYAQKLEADGVVSAEQTSKAVKKVQQKLQNAYKKLKKNETTETENEMIPPHPVSQGPPDVDTAVSVDRLREMNEELLKWPESFTIYSKLEKILDRRRDAFGAEGKVDWALAETLAFATILQDGSAIRLTGQDTERGTFAHRHLMLYDTETGEAYSPLHRISQARASFAIHNSPLSEAGVVGFEYGYDVHADNTLALWEAQYGDFANAAQVILDQFISAGRAKWGQKSNLVLLLPHGYEGQGPEHSSARLERFLQLAAENNWAVANLTSAAQYFHALRRQTIITDKEEKRPLVIMTPKSLIRNKRTASPSSAFTSGKLKMVLEQPGLGQNKEKVERLILCSGKISIDLATELETNEQIEKERLHIVRVEQLYPFPRKEIEEISRRFQNLKEVVWVQEEPQNMGAWTYMQPRIRELVSEQVSVAYIGRPPRSSPAEGQPDIHVLDQDRIVYEALHVDAPKTVSKSGGNGRE